MAEKKKDEFRFVINDDITYTSLNDFRDKENRSRLTQLNKMKKDFSDLTEKMERLRKYYGTKANASERKELQSEISDNEQEYYQLESDIHQLEKAIRYAELQKINP